MSDVPPQEPIQPDRVGEEDTGRGDYTRRLPPADRPAPPRPPAASPAAHGGPPRPRPAARPPGYPLQSAPPAYEYDPYLPPRRQRVSPRESGFYFPWWSLVVMVTVAGVAAFVVLLVIVQLTGPNTPGDQPPEVQVRNPTPTLGEQFLPGAGISNQPAPGFIAGPTIAPQVVTPTAALPTPIPSPSLPPGEFTIGATVQVVGVDTSGLNVRDVPGLGGTVRFRANEGDTFVVVEGPQQTDDLEWWKLEDPNDPNRFGWAARNFLTVISQ